MANMSNATNAKLGVIIKWDEKRGFGFIAQEHEQNDIFVHRVCLNDRTSVNVGQLVEFDFFWDNRKNKYQATFCQVIDNATDCMKLRLSHKFEFAVPFYQTPYYQQEVQMPYPSYEHQDYKKSDSITTISTICDSEFSLFSEDGELKLLPFDYERKVSHAFSTPVASEMTASDFCFDDEANPLAVECDYLFE